MEFLYAIILGIVQGLTEFLPVSSSGHLVLVAKYLDFEQPGILFEAILHAGTAISALWYLRNSLLAYKLNDIALVVIGSIPAALVGILFSNQIEGLFSITKLVGIAFLVSAYFNFQIDKQSGKRESLDKFDALFIGIFQAIAIIPGVSRSGATIFAGSKANLTKRKALEFSFLLSLPAIFGANIIEIYKHGGGGEFPFMLGVFGFVTSFVVGLLAIKFLISMLTTARFKIFGYYLAILGTLTILFL